jgi:Ala-tRNA(Pro) deacylase
MITTETELLHFLDEHMLAYQRVEHPPVYTCSEAEQYNLDLPTVSTKNLLLCDKKEENYFLVVSLCEKNLDLKHLAVQFQASRLHFASEQILERLLGVTRGAVTMMGLVNDVDHQVELWIDAEVWEGEKFLCHALVNTTTLVLSKESLQRFFNLSGHEVHWFGS